MAYVKKKSSHENILAGSYFHLIRKRRIKRRNVLEETFVKNNLLNQIN